MSGRIMIWANYRRGPSLAVPAPFDDNSSPYWWYDRISGWAQGWSRTGFTDVLFPNPLKCQGGAGKGCDGYGVFADFDVGTVDQQGSKPTRFGTGDQLRRAVAICKANGLNVLVDYVPHQRMGGKNGVYRYASATGPTNGRFPKDPGCFSPSGPNDTIPPYVHVDPVPDQADNFAFGNPLAPVNSVPKGYVWNGLLEAGDWLFRTAGADGARIDDTKGLNVGFAKAWMTHGAMAGKFFFGEYASGNPNDLNWWIGQVDGLASATDFGIHYNQIERMCNDGSYDMSRLKNTWETLYQQNPMKAVTFVESMDSDTNGFATIVFNKLLGYAHLLTNEGLPCAYIRDYLKEPDCYGEEDGINNLCWIAQMLAAGSTVPRLTNNQRVYVFERMGFGDAPGCVISLSNDYFNSGWNTVTVQTSFGANVHLHDFTGHNAQDCWTDAHGRVTFGVPPAAGGVGFGVWGPASMMGKTYHPPEPRYTTQEFFGADDLDISPLTSATHTIGRVWCDADKPISIRMLNVNGQAADFKVQMQIMGPDGKQLVQGHSDHVYGDTTARGWHTLIATGSNFGITERTPFILRTTYMATQDLHESEFGL